MGWGTITATDTKDAIDAALTAAEQAYEAELADNDYELDDLAKAQLAAAHGSAMNAIAGGSLGDGPFEVQISGHANPDHVPLPGFAPDHLFITIRSHASLDATPLPESAPPAVTPEPEDSAVAPVPTDSGLPEASIPATLPGDTGTAKAEDAITETPAVTAPETSVPADIPVDHHVGPAAPVITFPGNGDVLSENIAVIGTSEVGSITVFDGEATIATGTSTGSFSVSVTLPDGNHSLSACVSNADGESPWSEPVSITVQAAPGLSGSASN